MKTKILTLLFIILFISGCGVYDREYMKATHEEYEGHHTKSIGDINYDSAIMYFENAYYEDAINFCTETRNIYSKSITQFNTAYAKYEQSKIYPEGLIKLKLEYINVTKEIVWNKYEACEYLESAARLYSNEDMESGDAQIEIANVKVRAHDDLIPKANLLNSKIEVLEE